MTDAPDRPEAGGTPDARGAPPGAPDAVVAQGRVTARASCLLAPNPGMMTLDGTNTWVLAEPGADAAVVVDPGPLDEAHLARVARAVADAGQRVAVTLLTHGHPDHSDGAARFAELTGSPVRAVDPRLRHGGGGLAPDEVLRVDGLEVRVVAVPGHTSDSVAFHLPADRAVLSGDTVLGRGTTVVDHPDGNVAQYLASLRRLRELVTGWRVTTMLPGHGPVVRDALGIIDHYLAHRAERLGQVEAALAAGCRTAQEVVAHVYADVDRALWPVAERSVRAQLAYLEGDGGPD